MPYRMRFLDWVIVFDTTGNVFCGGGRSDGWYRSGSLEKADASPKSVEQRVLDDELYAFCLPSLFRIIMHPDAMATCFAGSAWRMVVCS
jgi:hypothetical protein